MRAGVRIEIWDASASPAVPTRAFDGLIVLGGGANPDGSGGPAPLDLERELIRDSHERGVPVLGICLGAQLAAQALGGDAFLAARREHGWFTVELMPEAEADPLLGKLPRRRAVMQWHAWAFEPPPCSVLLARNETCPQAFRAGETTWALQFHPEVTPVGLEEQIIAAGEELAALGFSASAMLEDTRRHLPAQLELAAHVATRFAGIVAAR